MPKNLLPEPVVDAGLKGNHLAEDVCKVLFEAMKKAEQSRNWDLFYRYADLYRRVAG